MRQHSCRKAGGSRLPLYPMPTFEFSPCFPPSIALTSKYFSSTSSSSYYYRYDSSTRLRLLQNNNMFGQQQPRSPNAFALFSLYPTTISQQRRTYHASSILRDLRYAVDEKCQRIILSTLIQSLQNREVIAVVGAGVSAAVTKVAYSIITIIIRLLII